MNGVAVTMIDIHLWFIEGHPMRDPIAQSLGHDFGVFREPIGAFICCVRESLRIGCRQPSIRSPCMAKIPMNGPISTEKLENRE